MADELILGTCQDAEPPGGIASGDGCDTGGVDTISFAQYKDINCDTAGWDGEGYCVTSMPMLQNAFYDLSFDIETATATFTKDDATGFYTNEVTVTVLGMSKENWARLTWLCRACNLVMCVQGLNCAQRWLGIERDVAKNKFKPSLGGLKLVSHTDTFGTPGESSRQELVFRSKSRFAPYFGTVEDKPLETSGLIQGKKKAA